MAAVDHTNFQQKLTSKTSNLYQMSVNKIHLVEQMQIFNNEK